MICYYDRRQRASVTGIIRAFNTSTSSTAPTMFATMSATTSVAMSAAPSTKVVYLGPQVKWTCAIKNRQQAPTKVQVPSATTTEQTHLDTFYEHFWNSPDHCSCRDEDGNDLENGKCSGDCRELPWYTNLEDEYGYMNFLLKTETSEFYLHDWDVILPHSNIPSFASHHKKCQQLRKKLDRYSL